MQQILNYFSDYFEHNLEEFDDEFVNLGNRVLDGKLQCFIRTSKVFVYLIDSCRTSFG